MKYLTIDEFLKVLYNRHKWSWSIHIGLILYDKENDKDIIRIFNKEKIKEYIGYCCSFTGTKSKYIILG